MIKYIKWLCLLISIIGMCLLGYLFIKKNPQTNKLDENTFKIANIQNEAWYKTKEETYENNELIRKITIIEPEYMIFLEKQIQYNNTITNEINSYNYEYEDNIITIHEAEIFLPTGTYNIALENEQLKLTQKENNIINIYYFTKAAG